MALGRLFYQDSSVHIFQDPPTKVEKLHAAFNQVEVKLHGAKVEYSLFLLAVFFVKLNMSESAAEFWYAKIAPHP